MKILFYILLFFCGLNSFGQDLTCEDFKQGTFKSSISDSDEIEWEIVRQGNRQVETITKIPQELIDMRYPTDSVDIKIQWIDECSYLLMADDSKGELTEAHKMMNDSGGVLTELIKIDGDCFHYKATMSFQGEEFVTLGKLCKVNEF